MKKSHNVTKALDTTWEEIAELSKNIKPKRDTLRGTRIMQPEFKIIKNNLTINSRLSRSSKKDY